ncbi:uncharacterized protein Nmag_4035 (plasmid) [Natrialba magadii ATCC 43099]|uniref:Uncharacterized protein n=1 Tax=Natrialba magadii (strain ATCC 43099 / DSM 3394 / CCM 3739 / CIP 104546 / IAM 13178 / JCM 8861 / NBRC 102185 / NCIMB 2190 / MS3) TaxID=547559 RepID=D3T1V5_NATMM|nr:hypothetical protein [Natrialba magadii]ADD07564.1 uncharacterized protein Nmag_4035 [Natrialba magadii ATCC 43099]
MPRTCAACSEPLEEGTGTCTACGNAPKRAVRKNGGLAFALAIPLLFLNPPIGVILAIVGLFVLLGSWFVSPVGQVAGSNSQS